MSGRMDGPEDDRGGAPRARSRHAETEDAKPLAPATPMGEGGEFDAIRLLLDRWGPRASGIGDDAAVLDVPLGERLVVTTDAAIEHVHFRREWMTSAQIAWRAVAAAASDVAAMGAFPLGIVFALGIPSAWRGELGALADGLGDACEQFGLPIIGGNLSAAGELSIVSTVMGRAAAPVPRSGARAGDVVYVTGRLGGPGAALAALLGGTEPIAAHRDRVVRPVPRIAEGRWLAQQGVRAMIDISDGLAADLGHLAAASSARIVVEVERVPLMPEVDPLAALRSGEEYELACVAPEKAAVDSGSFQRIFGLPLTRIGRVESGGTEVVLLHEGARVAPPRGHDHFSS